MVVRPPWQEYDPTGDDLVVLLDPGMAFGTGTHPTTQIALRLLETLELTDRSVFDVGTGSGIIAIAAAKLGASKVDGVDIDAVSVRQAQTNIDLNDARPRSPSGSRQWNLPDGAAPGVRHRGCEHHCACAGGDLRPDCRIGWTDRAPWS